MIAVGGMPNHIHLLIALPPAMALSVGYPKIESEFFAMDGRTGIDL
jgi:REP element-mobilizing transposase RayT